MTYEDLSLEEIEAAIQKKEKLRQLKSLDQHDSRAQAITIGTAGGGTTELTMRSAHGQFLWNVYQPVEVVELINQLAANIGCHIHIQPRNDFSSWRQWRELSEEERLHLNGFPPFPNDMALSSRVGTGKIEMKDRLKIEAAQQAEEKENAVATKKTVNKRSTKRSRTAAK
tara:strand:- start:1995 stop:2504 length:510 start_codon:yes stop_codon:yes gene_type:complete